MDRFELENRQAMADRQTVGPFAQAILVKTPQGTYAVSVEDLFVGRELRFQGRYSEGELNILRSFCHGGTRLLVVGAHIGALAIPLAKTCLSAVAIEANPNTFELLRLNVMLNGLNNCRLIQKAASNRVESLDFVLNTVNSGGSKRNPIHKERCFFYDNPEVVKVEAAPLDDLLPGETFDLIVMDIEGSEYFALLGMQRLLASAGALQIEFLPHHLRDVAGVTVADFAATIAPHFSSLCIIGKRLAVGREHFVSILSEMYERGEGDAGLFFLKIPAENVQFT